MASDSWSPVPKSPEEGALRSELASPSPGWTARSLFHDPTADAILRSSDNVEFRIHKSILSSASPVFKQRFVHEPGDGTVEEVHVSEASDVLDKVLTWCHPRGTKKLNSLQDIYTLAQVAKTYEMDTITKSLRQMLMMSGTMDKEPMRVFAIACRSEFEDVTEKAARKTLRYGVDKIPNVPELKGVSAHAIQRLYEYHFACGRAARETLEKFPWGDEEYCWFSSFGNAVGCACEKEDTPDNWRFTLGHAPSRARTSTWFLDHWKTLLAALYLRPSKDAIVVDPHTAKVLGAMTCKHCSTKGLGDLARFDERLGVLVDEAVAQVSPSIQM